MTRFQRVSRAIKRRLRSPADKTADDAQRRAKPRHAVPTTNSSDHVAHDQTGRRRPTLRLRPLRLRGATRSVARRVRRLASLDLHPLTRVQRGLGPVGRTDGLIVLAILLPCVGAAVGVGLHPKPEFRFAAESGISVRRGPGVAGTLSPYQLVVARYASEVVTLPQVIGGARTAALSSRSVSDITRDTTVVVNPVLGSVQIRVREVSEASALALANALAEGALSFVRANFFGSRDGTRALGDFEDPGLQGWGTVRSAFNQPPLELRSVQGSARFGSGKLRVTCPPAPGCGPSLRVYGAFRKGTTYTAEAWHRSTTNRIRVGLVLGVSSGDLGVGEARRLAPTWRRVVASWTPKADAASAELALQTRSANRAILEIDGVSVFDPNVFETRTAPRPRGVESPGDAASAFRLARLAAFVPAAPVIDDRDDSLPWALKGAVAGLLVALGAIGLARSARRRRDLLGDCRRSMLGGRALREESER